MLEGVPCDLEGGCLVVEFTHEKDGRYVWTGVYHAAPRIEGDGHADAGIAGVGEELD